MAASRMHALTGLGRMYSTKCAGAGTEVISGSLTYPMTPLTTAKSKLPGW